MLRVPYIDLAAQFAREREGLQQVITDALVDGHWVGGRHVRDLEGRLCDVNRVERCVTVGSGTDALIFALEALGIGPGDEVITPPNSFVSSTSAIVAVGARPVFADVLEDQTIDPARVAAAITKRTRAIMPVHLTGRMARMPALCELAKEHCVEIVEDAAQAFGSRLGDRYAGTFGAVGCFSAHPLKNFNAVGDAGFILTDRPDIADHIERLRNNGLQDRDTVTHWGRVSRLDSIQAAVLCHRLSRVDEAIRARRRHADRYRAWLNSAHVYAPVCEPDQFNTFHTFVIQVDRRDELQRWLREHGVGSGIHYPTPIHLQPAAADLGYKEGDFPVAERQAQRILSLPIHDLLYDDDIDFVAATVNAFFE